MHVDDDGVGDDAQRRGLQLALHGAEGVIHRVHVDAAQHIDDQHPATVGGDEDVGAPARRIHQARIVGRSDQARLAHDIGQGLALVPAVVAQRQDVGPGVEDVVGGVLGDAETARRVLGVDHHEIEPEVAPQPRKMVRKSIAPGLADHVTEKRQSHGKAL